jgi:DNA processing protein
MRRRFSPKLSMRNRIISGMSVGVMVVEGAQYSGSAVTAKPAVLQGGVVFAVPGNIASKLSWAPNLLIKQGPRLGQDGNAVVGESRRHLMSGDRRKILGEADSAGSPAAFATEPADSASYNRRGLELGGVARRTVESRKVDAPSRLDDLPEKMEDTASSGVMAALFELEMQGPVKQSPGKSFVKVW